MMMMMMMMMMIKKKEGSMLRIIIAVTLTLLLSLLTIHPPNFCTAHSHSEVRCIESEQHALLNFRQDLLDPSNRLASWASDVDCCHWVGVVCHNRTGHVLQLHLRTFYPLYDPELAFDDEDQWEAQIEAYERTVFSGKINPSLLDLKHLIYLDLSGNNFNGTQIPKFLGSMGSLRYLNLSRAGFGGKINPSLLDLKHLIYLDLSYNDFNETQIPKFLGSMGSLRYLNLAFARFGGLIPHQLGNLSNLYYLDLGSYYASSTSLYVKNLQWLSGLPLLQHLDLTFANLSQASDWLQEINKLPSLSELRLSACELSGFIPPPIPSSVNFSSLTTLDLSSNHFENTSILFCVFGLHNLVSLHLSGNQFQGPIPVHLQNLTSLRHLELYFNHFNSSIPNWLYSFSHLESLKLGGNNLQGAISSAIGNLTFAISLDLSYNELEGKVPRSFGNLCNLREITLSGNKWSTKISEIFEGLSGCVSNRLEILDLSNAQLSGQLTDELGQFKNLVILSLWSNSISGPIPWSIGNLSSLRSLDLGSNQINGTLPPSFGQLSKLEYLNIESNILKGVVSEVHFAKLMKLTTLLASQNQLTLEVRNSWIPPFQLNHLILRSWNLGPRFPLWLLPQKHLQDLDISNTRVSDAVPPLFWNLSSQLMYLNLSHNQIYGEIPNIPMMLSTLGLVIDMNSNHFNGSLPCISSNVSVLDLSDNLLSGSISHFLCYKMNESKRMAYLNLGKNLLSGEIIGCWRKWQNLFALNLGNNHLSGSIPRSIGSLIYLQSLHLYNNKFSGKLPSSLKNCKHLVTIDIGKNKFVGSIPSWMGRRFSSLMILSLHSNSFYGYIPEKLCSLTSLQILDLSNNKLFGSIPRCVNNFSAMATNNNSNVPLFSYDQPTRYGESWVLESALVVIKGKVLEYSTTLQLVKSIDLSKNNLSGEIPKEVTSLQGLQSLNLSFNILRGRIPDNIGVMGSLESIDFSVNQLSGQIPQSMSSLTFLSHLNLSNNNLSGKIPLSTQLQSLNASCFIGNRLCGAPLIEENCSISDVKPHVENKRSKDFGGPEVDWFYVSMALGFVVGFWVVLGPLLLNKQVRIVYFQFLDHLGFKLWGFVAQAWLRCK